MTPVINLLRQPVGESGYPTAAKWLNEVLSVNSRVGAYPNYVSTGTARSCFYHHHHHHHHCLLDQVQPNTCI